MQDGGSLKWDVIEAILQDIPHKHSFPQEIKIAFYPRVWETSR